MAVRRGPTHGSKAALCRPCDFAIRSNLPAHRAKVAREDAEAAQAQAAATGTRDDRARARVAQQAAAAAAAAAAKAAVRRSPQRPRGDAAFLAGQPAPLLGRTRRATAAASLANELAAAAVAASELSDAEGQGGQAAAGVAAGGSEVDADAYDADMDEGSAGEGTGAAKRRGEASEPCYYRL